NVLNGFFSNIGDWPNTIFKTSTITDCGIVEGQAGAGTHSEQGYTLTEVGLVSKGFFNTTSAACFKQVLQEGQRFNSRRRIVGVLARFIIEDITTESEGPACEAGSIKAQLVANTGGGIAGSTAERIRD